MLLMGCMLFKAAAEQAHAVHKSALPEWVLLVMWSVSIVLSIFTLVLPLNDMAMQFCVTVSNVLYPLGTIGLLVVLFRAQLAALQCGEEQ